MKHLQHMYETPETLEAYVVTCIYMQHPYLLFQHLDKTLATYVSILMKHLKHTLKTPLQHVQHPDLLFKHTSTRLATHKRRLMKHLGHASETLTTYAYKK